VDAQLRELERRVLSGDATALEAYKRAIRRTPESESFTLCESCAKRRDCKTCHGSGKDPVSSTGDHCHDCSCGFARPHGTPSAFDDRGREALGAVVTLLAQRFLESMVARTNQQQPRPRRR